MRALELTTFAAMLVIAASGIVFGLTGFGFALVSVPPLLLLYPPETVVTLTLCVGLLISGLVVRDAWEEFQPRVVLTLLPGALVGLFVGVQILNVVDPAWLKAAAGLLVTGYALLVLRGIEPRGMHSRVAPAVAGFASGTLATSVGLSGPPIVMLFTARRLPISAFRSSISVYFVVLSIVALVMLGGGRAIDGDDLITALALTPAGLIGTLAGNRIARRLDPGRFRTLTLVLLLVTGVVAVATVVAAFL
ncbi:MAG: hypothetical protein DCC58_02485 [Chloroflexi bacterium]|nr:MAG: hypothetical protein DCC58_02485 [Chloroflexota bacterium]